MKRTASSNARGFSTIQLIITIAVITIVTGFAVVSISRARDHVRLVNSARQFAAYVERARADSVRRHAAPANAATVSVVDNNTYGITMDWDGFGGVSTRNFDLEQGVRFSTIKTIAFDWRGRIPREESFGFDNGRDQVNVHVTGAGDVTFDTEQFFDASVPAPALIGPGGSVLPEPSPTPVSGSPSASPSPGASPTPTAGASPTPHGNPHASPTVNPSPTATADPSPTATADASPSPTATTSPQPCVVNAPDSLTIVSDASATVSVNRTNVTGQGTIYATSSNNGQIQVTPSSRNVDDTAAGSFTITVKKHSGSVTFSSSGCTSKTVDITVP